MAGVDRARATAAALPSAWHWTLRVRVRTCPQYPKLQLTLARGALAKAGPDPTLGTVLCTLSLVAKGFGEVWFFGKDRWKGHSAVRGTVQPLVSLRNGRQTAAASERKSFGTGKEFDHGSSYSVHINRVMDPQQNEPS